MGLKEIAQVVSQLGRTSIHASRTVARQVWDVLDGPETTARFDTHLHANAHRSLKGSNVDQYVFHLAHLMAAMHIRSPRTTGHHANAVFLTEHERSFPLNVETQQQITDLFGKLAQAGIRVLASPGAEINLTHSTTKSTSLRGQRTIRHPGLRQPFHGLFYGSDYQQLAPLVKKAVAADGFSIPISEAARMADDNNLLLLVAHPTLQKVSGQVNNRRGEIPFELIPDMLSRFSRVEQILLGICLSSHNVYDQRKRESFIAAAQQAGLLALYGSDYHSYVHRGDDKFYDGRVQTAVEFCDGDYVKSAFALLQRVRQDEKAKITPHIDRPDALWGLENWWQQRELRRQSAQYFSKSDVAIPPRPVVKKSRKRKKKRRRSLLRKIA